MLYSLYLLVVTFQVGNDIFGIWHWTKARACELDVITSLSSSSSCSWIRNAIYLIQKESVLIIRPYMKRLDNEKQMACFSLAEKILPPIRLLSKFFSSSVPSFSRRIRVIRRIFFKELYYLFTFAFQHHYPRGIMKALWNFVSNYLSPGWLLKRSGRAIRYRKQFFILRT